ncbi:MAG TPA: sugar ABC transporter permease [Polyangiaceae bacterium]|nr:sugar ABC transporter permease [Polyangiaceae bacterium]
MTGRDRHQLKHGLAFTAPWLLGISIFTLYPVAASLFYSFCDYSILQPPVFSGLENYNRLFGDDLFWKSLKNTLFYAALSVPLSTAVALSLALLVNCEVRGTAFFRAAFYLPSVVPLVASCMIWMWILNGNYGVMNWALSPIVGLFGEKPPRWLFDPNWSKPALVLMGLWGVGNSMIIYLAGLQDVPKELYEAAEIDGASTWRQFWHVTLPMLSPVIYFNVIMGIIGSLQVFTQAYVMTSTEGGTADGAPARSTLFYALYLYSTAFHDLRMGYASAMAWVLFIIIVALTVLATRWFGKRVHYGR